MGWSHGVALAAVGAVIAILVLVVRRVHHRTLSAVLDGETRRGAYVVVGDVALYVVATVRGVDAKAIARAWRAAPRVFEWASTTPQDPVRSILWLVVQANAQALAREEDREERLATSLAEHGLQLVELEVHAQPYDDAARARFGYWIVFVRYVDSHLTFHCNALEWWLDAVSGSGLWSLRTVEGTLTSVQTLERSMRFSSCVAGASARHHEPRSWEQLAS